MTRIVENPDRVRRAEIVVGIPSFNEAESIGFVVSQVDQGLTTFFEKKDAVILNVDNHSPDDTKTAFFRSQTRTPKLYISTPKDQLGKGRNIRNLFEAGVELGAKAIVMVDADLKSIRPQWIRYFLEPLFMDNDYVIPLYVRHKFDGTITNSITYPLARVLYGVRTRQPIAGDFGFSGRLARAYLSEKTWNTNTNQFGIDIWMTTIALARGFKVCQAFLGAPKAHRAKDPGLHLSRMFFQVVETVFHLAVEFEYLWKDVSASVPTSIFGFGLGVKDDPPRVKIDKNNLCRKFQSGKKIFSDVWNKVIAPLNLDELTNRTGTGIDEVGFPAELWARILFDYIVAFRDKLMPRGRLLRSLVPIYFIRTLAYVNATQEMETKEAEEHLDSQCRIMEAEKYYLIAKWNQTPRRDGIPSIAQFLAE